MADKLDPTILVIVGISGDLSKRKLLPALAKIAEAGQLPEQFHVVGISRRNISVEEVLQGTSVADNEFLIQNLEMRQMNLDAGDDYIKLAGYLDSIEQNFGASAQRLFYLSVPPEAARPVIANLGESGLSGKLNTKLLLEKPFGTDLVSAEELVRTTNQYFKEEQVYRIDHFLAKEMAQNIMVFRGGNSLLKRTWNKDFIEKIEITASEDIGIEGRSVFYEQTGALRDVVQSHLLQLAALTLMELPKPDNLAMVPGLRLQALRDIEPPAADSIHKQVVRGQYKNYKQEAGNPDSATETFASLTLFSKNPRWDGVPINLITGKALDRKATEIKIHYRQDDASESNQLILHIQPHEGIEFCLWSKEPGYDRKLEEVSLNFNYKEYFDSMPEAYEQVLVDAMRSDHSLFTSSEEVKASWEILAPVQQAWTTSDDDLIIYEPGSSPEIIIN